jgi:hypothetical protein
MEHRLARSRRADAETGWRLLREKMPDLRRVEPEVVIEVAFYRRRSDECGRPPVVLFVQRRVPGWIAGSTKDFSNIRKAAYGDSIAVGFDGRLYLGRREPSRGAFVAVSQSRLSPIKPSLRVIEKLLAARLRV